MSSQRPGVTIEGFLIFLCWLFAVYYFKSFPILYFEEIEPKHEFVRCVYSVCLDICWQNNVSDKKWSECEQKKTPTFFIAFDLFEFYLFWRFSNKMCWI